MGAAERLLESLQDHVPFTFLGKFAAYAVGVTRGDIEGLDAAAGASAGSGAGGEAGREAGAEGGAGGASDAGLGRGGARDAPAGWGGHGGGDAAGAAGGWRAVLGTREAVAKVAARVSVLP